MGIINQHAHYWMQTTANEQKEIVSVYAVVWGDGCGLFQFYKPGGHLWEEGLWLHTMGEFAIRELRLACHEGGHKSRVIPIICVVWWLYQAETGVVGGFVGTWCMWTCGGQGQLWIRSLWSICLCIWTNWSKKECEMGVTKVESDWWCYHGVWLLGDLNHPHTTE